ncbi:MAG: methyltransferase domain-containing protein [Burkholderiaceae bacterium]|nr:methyltransferase domain-containing protein [Burkholderiaceae bacterium]
MPLSSADPTDLQRVRGLFASPARIAASAFLRREIARRMAERLDLIKYTPDSLLDAGCGTGDDLLLLHRHYPQARLAGVDLSEAMLAAAEANLTAAQSAWQKLLARVFASKPAAQLDCADFAALPQTDNSVGLLWSNLALHWHSQPAVVFAEWRRVLQTDGLLMFSCFGPDTFIELRRAFSTIDNYPHTLAFVDMHDLGDALVQAGFATPVMDMERITVTYDTPEKLLADARSFGGNPLTGRRRSLLGRQAHRRLLQALDAQRNADGKIPLSFEILYGHAFKPAPQTTGNGETIVRFAPRQRDR